MSTTAEFDGEEMRAAWDRQHEINAQKIESDAGDRAYKAGLGVGEWEAFLTPEEIDRLNRYADGGFGTWGRERKLKRSDDR